MKGIIDTTLREGEQSAHVYFNLAEKLHIIGLLDKVRVDEIEAGVAVMNPETKEFFRQVRERNLKKQSKSIADQAAVNGGGGQSFVSAGRGSRCAASISGRRCFVSACEESRSVAPIISEYVEDKASSAPVTDISTDISEDTENGKLKTDNFFTPSSLRLPALPSPSLLSISPSLSTPRLSLWCRCQASDIDETLRLCPDILSMSIPVSDIHIKKKLGKDRGWVLARVRDSIKQAKDTASPPCYLSLGLEDASRADPAFVEEVCSLAQEEGINRIRFADTVGIMDPMTMMSTVTRLRSLLKVDLVDLGVHTHNDFGMATANAISALAAGADFIDVTVNGLGERAGNAALEEVVAFLAKRKGVEKYNLKPLRFLSDYVARASHTSISPKKPIVGKDIFTCESGIHLDGLIKNPSNYEPYDPAEVCMERKFLVSKKGGRHSLKHKLESLGLKTEGHLLVELLMKIKDESSRLKTDLTDEELLHLYAMQQDSVHKDGMQGNAVQRDAVQSDAVQDDAVQRDAVQEDAMQPDAVQRGAVQENAVQ
jgi:homocitrate synthase NifV